MLLTKVSILLLGLIFTCILSHVQRPDSISQDSHFTNDGQHNVTFDHEAFLGKELAAELKLHTFDENKKKLVEIIAKIDKDKSGTITEPEMYDWIKKVSEISLERDAKGRWIDINPTEKPVIDLDEFITNAYGPPELLEKEPDYAKKIELNLLFEKRRWKFADQNGDNKLNFEEFKAMIHPEEYHHMKDVVIDETLATMDLDNDGLISAEEYVKDLAKSSQKEYEPHSAWSLKEAANFDKFRDKDHDGKLDRSEISEWIMPRSYDQSDAETKHLFYHADKDKDGKLTKKEVLDSQSIFIGSQATNYGKHSEL